MSDALKISMITPNWNGGEFIEATLRSVLHQEYPNLEYVVVDGASTDDSLDVIDQYQPQLSALISEPDDGHADALNKGFAVTDGEIMGWINSSDILLPGCLATVDQIFRQFPAVDWITGRPGTLTKSGVVYMVRQARPWSWLRFLCGDYRHIQQESTFWRRSLWEKAGGYVSTEYKLACDFELWTRFIRHALVYSVDAVLFGCFREHEDQRSRAGADRYDEECHDAIRSLWDWLPATAIAEFANVLGVPYELQPVNFREVSRSLMAADPQLISIDHTTREKRFALYGGVQGPPRSPKPAAVDELDLVFKDRERMSWTTGPDFASSEFVAVEISLRSEWSGGEDAPATPLLAGPVAVYDFGEGQFLVQVKVGERTESATIACEPEDVRLKVVVGRGKLLIVRNGEVVHRGSRTDETFGMYAPVPVVGTGSLEQPWSGAVAFIRTTSRGADASLHVHELRCLPQAQVGASTMPSAASMVR